MEIAFKEDFSGLRGNTDAFCRAVEDGLLAEFDREFMELAVDFNFVARIKRNGEGRLETDRADQRSLPEVENALEFPVGKRKRKAAASGVGKFEIEFHAFI